MPTKIIANLSAEESAQKLKRDVAAQAQAEHAADVLAVPADKGGEITGRLLTRIDALEADVLGIKKALGLIK